MKKKIWILIAVVVLTLLCAIFYNHSKNQQVVEGLQVANEQRVENTTNNTTDIDDDDDEDDDDEDEGKPVSTDKFKLLTENAEYIDYGQEEASNDILGTTVKISGGKAFVTIDTENENVKSFNQGDQKLENIIDQEITGFSSKPVKIYYGSFGQDIAGETFLFLMEDGTVEYLKYMTMFEKQSFVSEGKLKDLTNIQSFDTLDVEENESWYLTTVAIDKDGYYYDLSELIKFEE